MCAIPRAEGKLNRVLHAQSEGRHTFYEIDGPAIASRMEQIVGLMRTLAPLQLPLAWFRAPVVLDVSAPSAGLTGCGAQLRQPAHPGHAADAGCQRLAGPQNSSSGARRLSPNGATTLSFWEHHVVIPRGLGACFMLTHCCKTACSPAPISSHRAFEPPIGARTHSAWHRSSWPSSTHGPV